MTMVTMGSVWDRTSEVLSGRAAMLAAIAIPTIFLPSVVRDAYVTYATPGTAPFRLIGGLLSLIAMVVLIWGQLALIAAASDPATDRARAFAIGKRRLLPVIGVTIVFLIAVLVSLLPAMILLGLSGIDVSTVATTGKIAMQGANGGMVAAAFLYLAIWSIAMLFVGARLSIWQPVLVNEHIGLQAIARSWRLTKGATWRILGVLVLFMIVLLVATGAAQSVVGIVFRLILGANNIATAVFLATIAANIVSTIFVVIAAVFTAQLYRALAGPRAEHEVL